MTNTPNAILTAREVSDLFYNMGYLTRYSLDNPGFYNGHYIENDKTFNHNMKSGDILLIADGGTATLNISEYVPSSTIIVNLYNSYSTQCRLKVTATGSVINSGTSSGYLYIGAKSLTSFSIMMSDDRASVGSADASETYKLI